MNTDTTGSFQSVPGTPGGFRLAPPQLPTSMQSSMSPMSSPSQMHRPMLAPPSPTAFGGWAPSSPTGMASPMQPPLWATVNGTFPMQGPSSPGGPGFIQGTAMPTTGVSASGGYAGGGSIARPYVGGTSVTRMVSSVLAPSDGRGPVMTKVPSDGRGPRMTKVPSDRGPFVSKVPSDGGSCVSKVPSLGGRSTSDSGSGSLVSPLSSPKVDDLGAEVRNVCERIDTDGNGFISKLELIAAVQNDPVVAAYVLPGKVGSKLMSCEETFDEVDAIFDQIACGKQRIKFAAFAAHFRKAVSQTTSNAYEMRAMYDLIDADGSGSISKLELVAAVQAQPAVAAFILRGEGSGNNAMNCEKTFDAINSVFESIAGGKRRIDFADFEAYFKKVTSLQPRQRVGTDRSRTRVFIIGPGFGQQLTPRQGAMVTNAGYQVHYCHGIPNPETPNFPVHPYLAHIKAEIDAFQPDVVCCASKGGVYMVGLWQMGYWRGPTVLINAHPSCRQLPEGINVVLCQGGNDEVYPTPRAELERLLATGTENQCFLYYVANSGKMASGQHTRMGDFHNMESLLFRDTLPRLIDATLCPEGPEVHMVRSWRERLSEDRIESELWLGYSPERLRKHWATKGMDEQKLHQVFPGSEEYQRVAATFKASPKEPPAYQLNPQAAWERTRILSIQRVENGLQTDGSTKPYYDSLRRTLEDQGVDFEPGTHTCWAFHGAQPEAIESIISNPLAGFQPLASGTRNSNVWGSGTYFAREAKYVAEGGFCGQPAPDGTRRMLMCLLMTGMPCLGDPAHKGVLPFRIKPHRYNSSVDSLSSPEIYIVQHPGGALPAYLITFA